MKIENIKEFCTGCTACKHICPTKSIEMFQDEEGFYYPKINHKTCISCFLCDKNCHCLSEDNNLEQNIKSYYGYSKNEEVLMKSSSGGVFYHLSEIIQEEGGIIFGAAFDYKDYFLKHYSTNEIDIEKLMKSKYIESDMNNSIEKVQKQVNDGKKVLFCGTPCQVKGLKEAIKDSNGNLLTCDFICHGVPSSLVFKDYLESFYGKDEVTEIDFRPKSIGWSKKNIIIKTKKKVINKPYYLDYYYRGFMKENIFLRRACYRCKFRKKHYSDITIADFWGYKDLDIKLNNEKGLSLIITNTEIGKNYIEKLKNFKLYELDKRYSKYVYNKKDLTEKLEKREIFFKEYKKRGFKYAAKKTYMKYLWKMYLKYYIRKILKK